MHVLWPEYKISFKGWAEIYAFKTHACFFISMFGKIESEDIFP
jgi:hypothetical protein